MCAELATPEMLDGAKDSWPSELETIAVWPPWVSVPITVAVTVGVMVTYDVITAVHSIGITGHAGIN